ncbi:hypothetical protein CJ030_MR6G010825 [Morella rubra]|uniref:Uncharacterized protein n=1 Tax=Morella rubra TaxID=262757 RepID=A0A6A1VCG2_9ROSI|nr:hypothetical protein CJ030_MR6G010825 [Morella rubra]
MDTTTAAVKSEPRTESPLTSPAAMSQTRSLLGHLSWTKEYETMLLEVIEKMCQDGSLLHQKLIAGLSGNGWATTQSAANWYFVSQELRHVTGCEFSCTQV